MIAATAQTVRFILQKHLSQQTLTVGGATFSRFVFSLPLVVALVTGYMAVTATPMPDVSFRFFLWAAIGGLFQMLATVCVVETFKHRNFAIGVTLKKTEVIMAAIVGLILLGDPISGIGWFGLIIGLVGVLILSDPPQASGAWRHRIWNKAAGLGILSGVLFAFCGVSLRAAILELGTDDVFLRPMFALVIVVGFQTAVMAVWLRVTQKGQITRVLGAWKTAGFIGIAGMIGSLGWFTAFSQQTVAYVVALGQVELIFTLMASVFVFKETAYWREFVGVCVLLTSILIIVLAA